MQTLKTIDLTNVTGGARGTRPSGSPKVLSPAEGWANEWAKAASDPVGYSTKFWTNAMMAPLMFAPPFGSPIMPLGYH